MSIKCHQSPYLSTRGLYNLNLKNTWGYLVTGVLPILKEKKKKVPKSKKKINTESVYSA